MGRTFFPILYLDGDIIAFTAPFVKKENAPFLRKGRAVCRKSIFDKLRMEVS